MNELVRIFREIERIWMSVPDSELERLPRDGSGNHDKYLYGGRY